MDTTGPTINSLTGLPGGSTKSAAWTADITFSEPINAATLTPSDIVLTRDGVPVDTSTLSITPLSTNRFRIGGLSALTTAQGNYQFSIAGASIIDIAGNAGAGSILQSWNVDLSAPAVAHALAFTPDSGVLDDGVTNSLSIVVAGMVDETGVTVDLFDVTTLTSLGSATLVGITFTKAIDFTVVGNHQLRVRVADAAGNVADSFLNVFIDQSAPTVASFVGIPATTTATPPDFIDFAFTEPIDTTNFDRSHLKLTRNGGSDLLPFTIALTQLNGTTLRLSGLAGLIGQNGSYVLTVDTTGVVDRAGNSGTASVTANWVRDTTALQPATLRGKIFNDKNESKIQDSGEEALVGWTIFLDANRSGTLDPGERSTTTDANGQYIFDNLAPGTYAVAQLVPAGWAQTFPGDSPAISGETAALSGSATSSSSVVSSTTIIDDISGDAPTGQVAKSGTGFAWTDHDLSTPDIIDIFYDFRSLNGFSNQMTQVQQALAEQALAGWATSTSGIIHFVRNTTAAFGDIINIGTGDLAALGYVSGSRHTMGIGGGLFSSVGDNRTITNGVVWLDVAEVWDNAYANGEQSGTYDYFTVVSREIGHALGITETQLNPMGTAIIMSDGESQSLFFQSHCGCGGMPVNGFKYATEVTTLSATDHTLIQTVYGNAAAGQGGNSQASNGFYTGTGTGYNWLDHDLSSPGVIDVYYDFRSLNGYVNQITTTEIAMAEQALAGWETASLGRIHFIRNTTVSDSEIIIIGTGDLAALGGVSGVSGTLALGGGTFSTIGGRNIITSGTAWLDSFETWDVTYANGNITSTYDCFTVVAHEIGHAVGLGHTDSLSGPDIMDGTYAGEKTTFSANDQYLIRMLYASTNSSGGQSGGSTGGGGGGDVSIVPTASLGVHVVTVEFNQTLDNLDFGDLQFGLIAGRRWNDTDRDGGRDVDEPFTNGWTITLVNSAGQITSTTVTADWDRDGNGVIDPETETGWYRFENLRPGQYIVRETSDVWWKQTVPSIGDAKTVFDLDRQFNFTAAGTNWNNWGGLGEKWFYGRNGWHFITPEGDIYLWNKSPRTSLTGTPVAQVNSRFYDDVSLITDPSNVLEYRQQILEGQSSFGLDFGDYQLQPATVRGRMWHDLNGNGVYDVNEPFLNGTSIKVLNAAGTVVATTLTTDIDLNDDGTIDPLTEHGWYVFDQLLPGQYTIVDELPSNAWRTAPTDPVAVLAVQLDQSFKFTKSAKDWYNWAGQQEKWFYGTNGWNYVVPDGTIFQWVRGSQSPVVGNEIAKLSERYYQHPEDIYDPRQPETYRVHLNEGATVDGFDFGIALSVTGLTGQFFEDLNRNGQYDSGEPTQNGARVDLLDSTGQIVATTITTSVDLNGNGVIDSPQESGWYTITGLGEGPYEVQFVPLNGSKPDVDTPARNTARSLSGLHIRSTGNLFTNVAGLGEKRLWSENRWVFITPDGSLYSAPSGNAAASARIGVLDNEHYVNLDLLTSPPLPQQARIRFNAFDEQKELHVPLIPDVANALDALFGDLSSSGLP